MTKFSLSLLAILTLGSPAWPADLAVKNAPVQVYFSPNGGCTDASVTTIREARKTIFVQAYSFTSAPIAQALKQAHDRDVSIMAILDKSQRSERYTVATFLVHAGIPTWIDSTYTIAHNKVMIIDGEIVNTSSFNFTKAAEEKNAENLLIIRDTVLTKLYRDNWEAHLRHSEKSVL